MTSSRAVALDLPVRIGQRQTVTEASGAETRDETRWVEAARRGDRGAFERLYDRYAAVVHGILLARVPRLEIEDLTLVLRLVEGMTGPEIAARTGLTPGSVRVNLHRGMAQLREKLARRETHG